MPAGQPGRELLPVRLVRLTIGLPNERDRGPMGPYEGVLTPDKGGHAGP
jgi:hypothetical protein